MANIFVKRVSAALFKATRSYDGVFMDGLQEISVEG
jgi:hypothetical protein